MSKPTRTFAANEGQPSVGSAGPDQIEYDLDNLFAMFNPMALLRDGTPGGIAGENIRSDSITDDHIGYRTIDDLQELAADTALLSVLLSALANRIKQIKGTATWRDNAALTIAQIAQTVGPSGILPGKATDAVIGTRTIDQAQLPTSDSGTLSELLGRIANRLVALAGTANWKDSPPTNLAAVKAHMDAAAPHTGHETPAGAQAKVNAHAAQTADVHGVDGSGFASKSYVDSKVAQHEARQDNPHGTTAAQVGAITGLDVQGAVVQQPGGTVGLRAGTGIALSADTQQGTITITATGEAASIPQAHAFTHAQGGSDPLTPGMIGAETPASSQAKVDAHAALTTAHGSTPIATPGAIMQRDSAGRAKVAAPNAPDDIARKQEVDAVQSALNTHKTSGDHDSRYLRADVDATASGDVTLAKRLLGAAMAAVFAGAQTVKSALRFLQASGSNDPGAIVHETSGTAGYENKAVLHLMPGDDNDNANDYVSIHGQGQPETIKLFTGGNIETPGTVKAGGAEINGLLNLNTASGRAVAPVGADKWAT